MTIREIMEELLPVDNSKGHESEMMDTIEGILDSDEFECEIGDRQRGDSWGMYFKVIPSSSPRSDKGVLLLAHLDSHLSKGHNFRLDEDGGGIKTEGKVGLDDKTGIAVILDAVQDLEEDEESEDPCVHVYFSVREEIGQKGSLKFPLKEKIAGKVRYAIAVDRMTRKKGPKNQPEYMHDRRHFINNYMSMPTTVRGEMEKIMWEMKNGLLGCASPNCSDILELKGRWDCEYVLADPAFNDQVGENLRTKYREKTEEVNRIPLDDYVGFRESPRIDRYWIMHEVAHLISDRARQLDEKMILSAINLSLDYSEGEGDGYVRFDELTKTSDIIKEFVARVT